MLQREEPGRLVLLQQYNKPWGEGLRFPEPPARGGPARYTAGTPLPEAICLGIAPVNSNGKEGAYLHWGDITLKV